MAIGVSPKAVTNGLVFCMDAANQKSYSQNTFSSPLDLHTWYSTRQGNNNGNNCTVEKDLITGRSPAGGIPMRMNVTGDDPHIASYNGPTWNISSVSNLQTWTVSVYVKGSVATTSEIVIFGANSSGIGFVSGSWIGITGKTINVTTEWTRQEHQITFNNANVAFIHMRLDGPNAGGAGQTIWWDGLQVELASAATPFESIQNPNRSLVRDLSGNSNNGTLGNNPTFSTNSFGSLVFNGTNSIVNVPFNAASMNFSLGQTICMWLRPGTGANSTRRNPYNQAYGGSGTITHETNSGLNYFFGTNGGDGLPYVSRGSGFTVLPNELAFISVTRDQATNVCKWYKNGQLITTLDAGGYAATANGTSQISIGFGYAGAYLGDIYDCKVYNRALSDQEILQNFNALRGRFGL